jgi:hypothetical protein
MWKQTISGTMEANPTPHTNPIPDASPKLLDLHMAQIPGMSLRYCVGTLITAYDDGMMCNRYGGIGHHDPYSPVDLNLTDKLS